MTVTLHGDFDLAAIRASLLRAGNVTEAEARALVRGFRRAIKRAQAEADRAPRDCEAPLNNPDRYSEITPVG
jgi:hypothetical protein